MKRALVLLLGLGLGAMAVAISPMGREQFMMDSLRQEPPRLRVRWLNARGLVVPGTNAALPSVTDSTGLRLVGKYGRGPSVEVTGRDTLVFLSLGSEVAIINFADTANPQVLAEVQAMGLVTQAALRDSFLYIGCNSGQAGIEIWNIDSPSAPVFRSRTPTLLSDFCVRDTLLYLTQSLSGPNDTFKVYSIASPTNVYLLGSCRDSGDAVTVANNAAFLADRWGVYSVDVSDPRNPHQVGTYPGMPISVEARGNICCVTFGNPNDPEWLEFDVLDVRSPASMQRLGYLSDVGGSDMMLDGALVFLSGYFQGSHEFRIVSLADSTHPVALGQCATPGMNFGVWGDSARGVATVADRTEGLAVIDVHSLSTPSYDRALMVAGVAEDVSVDRDFCYVASLDAGMKILDITKPSELTEVGALDSVSTGLATFSAVARDSFAYVCWWPQPYLRVANVADPANPRIVAGDSVFTFPQDMVLRDSLLYIAEQFKFQIVDVARPRAPTVVGSCGMVDGTQWGLVLQDSFAYCGSWDGLSIVNVADPAAPFVVSQTSGTRVSTDGVAVRETLAFVPSVCETLWVYSVANPASPYPIAGAPLGAGNWGYDAAMYNDTLVFAGCKNSVVLVNVSDPEHPRAVSSYATPSWVRRVFCSPTYLYACCTDGGVAIFETAAVGIAEIPRLSGRRNGFRATPNPAWEWVDIIFATPLADPCRLSLMDVAGREVASARYVAGPLHERRTRISLRDLAPGLYFLRASTEGWSEVLKIVKQ